MPKSDLIFGSFDTSASSGRYYKTQPINFSTPEKDVETFKVPGRSGALLVDYGSYRNVEIAAEIAIQAKAPQTFLTLYDALKVAMMGQSGYQRLEDSLYSGEYRMARAVGVEMKQTDTMNGTATVTFDAKPQRYLTSGDQPAATLTPTITPLTTVTGMPDDLFNADALTAWDTTKNWTGITGPVMCVDISQFPRNYVIKIQHTNDYASDYAAGMLANGPFAADTFGSANPIHKYVVDGLISIKIPQNGWSWVIVDYPENVWIEDTNGDIVGGVLPNMATITPPNQFPFCPLLKLSWLYQGGTLSIPLAVAIGGASIGLNIPEIYTTDGGNLVSMYIDCETYNAYMYDGQTGAVLNLNKYVTITGKMAFEGPTTVSMGAGLYQVVVYPKWWTI